MSMKVPSAAGKHLSGARRLVIKVGSAILCGDDGVNAEWLSMLAKDIQSFRVKGVEIIIVSSGAIALGRKRLGLSGALRLDEKQAASAAGQTALLHAWENALAPHSATAAQILLTLDETENRRRYLNARATLRTLLDFGAVPVINENDTVATSEIRYGDNDRLAAHAAQIVEADTLLILSDIDGVYDADPRLNKDAKRQDVIEEITAAVEAAAAGPNETTGLGSGGMASKIAAAKIAGRNGCATIIADGHDERPLQHLLQGGGATLICAAGSPAKARMQWIAGRLKPSGDIVVDEGAASALRQGASLLPAGVISVTGVFSRGDAVRIMDRKGQIIGQGLSAYHHGEAKKIAGRKSEEIEALIGYKRRPAMIEKSDLALATETQ